MIPVVYAYPVYKFLFWVEMFRSENDNLEKSVLDCGAGGNRPPLALFYQAGYKTTGIDISKDSIRNASIYSKNHNMNLNINTGDMRELKFEDACFSFVYSYNSIFHLFKRDIIKSIKEMKRVLKPNGLIFINLLSVEDQLCGKGKEVGVNEFLQQEGEDLVIHSFFEDDEADSLFEKNEIIHKEKRFIDFSYEGKPLHQVYIDFIVKKG